MSAEALRVLFVCSRNRLRSLTAEHAFAGRAGLEVLSAGLNKDSETVVDRELLEWADVVFVMERAHLARLRRAFGDALRHQRVVCLDVPDRYAYMDPELVALLEQRMARYL